VVDEIVKSVNRMAMMGLFFALGLGHIAPGITGREVFVNGAEIIKL